MLNILNNNKVFGAVALLLLLLTALLVQKSSSTIMTIASLRQDIVTGTSSSDRNFSPAMLRASYRDSMLTSLIDRVKDPFFKPEVKAPVVVQATKVEAGLPKLNILIYDGVAAMAKLSIDDVTSSWLKVGDSYGSWRVTAINDKQVTIKRGQRELVLN